MTGGGGPPPDPGGKTRPGPNGAGGDGNGNGNGEKRRAAPWRTLDKDLKRIGRLEYAAAYASRPLAATGFALAFLVLVGLAAAAAAGGDSAALAVIAAAVFGGYMALNIGANDVANNMGPAVGARALSMGGALALAALCETAGALLAGGDVVETVARGIIDPAPLPPGDLLWAMMAALVAAAGWVNLATWVGAPVSTTHSVVGGVLGAGLAAAGTGAVNWHVLGAIGAGWALSPLLGGAGAALFLAAISRGVLDAPSPLAAATRWVPALIGLMAGAFAAYLGVEGPRTSAHLGWGPALGLGAALGVLSWALSRPLVARQAAGLEDRGRSVKRLFAAPLAAAAALLSFAHGANDVANAVGPVAAIVRAAHADPGMAGLGAAAPVPVWVTLIGALGISLGLFLFGPRLVRLVGDQITRLNPVRAFCVALSAAVTVLLASALGLPVSSTHVAVGGVFGVGFLREWWWNRAAARPAGAPRMAAEERRRRKLVRRSHFLTIAAAWVVTAPAAGLMAAGLFLILRAALG